MLPILLVDDEAPVRRFIKLLLVRQGYDVLEADDGFDAWSTLQNLKGDLSLIVSDVRMPRLDGITLCHQVKKGFPHIPVLLYSGNTPEASSAGDRFFQKPVHPVSFINAVRDLVKARPLRQLDA